MLLNSAKGDLAGWNAQIVDGLLSGRILDAYLFVLRSVTYMCQQRAGAVIPIVLHGYDYPVPDGRGFLGGWPFPGPWLEPGFREKLFTDLPRNVDLMRDLIDRFNAMLAGIVAQPEFGHVRYLDLRGTLSTQLADDAYRAWWGNELHPTEQGFTVVADRFAQELARLA